VRVKNSTLLFGDDDGRSPGVCLILYEEKHFCPLQDSNPDSPIIYSMALLLVPILTELPPTFENATCGPYSRAGWTW
jgi:hypothetical protein